MMSSSLTVYKEPQAAQARNMSASDVAVEKYKDLYGRKTVDFTTLVYFLPPMWCLGQFSAIPVSFSSITLSQKIYRERAMELKLTGIALNCPKNHIGGKKYTREVMWVIFI